MQKLIFFLDILNPEDFNNSIILVNIFFSSSFEKLKVFAIYLSHKEVRLHKLKYSSFEFISQYLFCFQR